MNKVIALTKVTRNGQITLPAAIRRAAGIEEGDLVAVSIENGTITLAAKRLIDKTQAYFWTESWQQGEREASYDIAAGRLRAFDDAEDLVRALKAGKVRCSAFSRPGSNVRTGPGHPRTGNRSRRR